jgi:hypothetical protein
MGELATNRFWGGAAENYPSPYTRMILGNRGTAQSQNARAEQSHAQADSDVVANLAEQARKTRARAYTPIEELLPHPTGDRFLLFQLVFSDLVVLMTVCWSLLFLPHGWGLPWVDLPIFGVLVTLFGFSEGLYKSGREPYPEGAVAILMRSTLFATGLVLLSASDAIHPVAAVTMFVTSLTGLIVCRRFKQTLWNHRQRETGLRKVLIIGGGPAARSIARSLRDDPIGRATVCGLSTMTCRCRQWY